MKLLLAAAAALSLLAAHPTAKSEWWYYTGQIQTREGARLGFELTFFRVRLADGGDVDAAHFALSDISRKAFFFDEKLHRPFPGIAGADEKKLSVFVENWEAREEAGRHILRASSGGNGIDLALTPAGPAVLNGAGGISRKGAGADDYSRYVSIPRLAAEGTVTRNGKTERVTGTAWFDHEFGPGGLPSGLSGWDWFSAQLSDGTALMLYRLRLKDGSVSGFSSGTFFGKDGRSTTLAASEFDTRATGSWTSPKTRATYPAGWDVRIPSKGIDVKITPLLADQELVTPRSTRVTYWEGACSVSGERNGRPVTGESYVELTGYADRDPR
ncbi:MAG: lipocalin-like domain-containing protein [Thermoanaerobaculia bacterium]